MEDQEQRGPRLALRIIAAALILLGAGWDLATAWWYLRPGPSGEWARLALVAAPMVGIPAGFFAFLALYLARLPVGRTRTLLRIGAGTAIGIPLLLIIVAWIR